MFSLILRLCCIFARQVEIGPMENFTFYDSVEKGRLFKLVWNFRENLVVDIFDPKNKLIVSDISKSIALFTSFNESGRIKISVRNLDRRPANFSYKCPDPEKEILGHVGYIKDKDLITTLTNHLNKFVNDQEEQIRRTKDHYEAVKSAKKWSKLLMWFEVISICICIYFVHKSFVSMFEQKKIV